MPNWCSNILAVTGPQEELERFQRQAGFSPNTDQPEEKKRLLDFSNFIPVPDVLLDRSAGFEVVEWQQENWGCKWGACDTMLQTVSPEKVCYWFNTAWSPPVKFLLTVSKQYPALRFKMICFEELNHYFGDLAIQNGEMQDEFVDLTK